jgi:hypothetical protein
VTGELPLRRLGLGTPPIAILACVVSAIYFARVFPHKSIDRCVRPIQATTIWPDDVALKHHFDAQAAARFVAAIVVGSASTSIVHGSVSDDSKSLG